MKPTIKFFGRLLSERRGTKTLREVAAETGVSAATLSRIESGYPPDLQTFRKLCQWMQVDPGEVLDLKPTTETATMITVLRRRAFTSQMAQELADMIMAAQRSMAFGAKQARLEDEKEQEEE